MDRVTVAEAAERLGISQDAVRQRIRRGTIDHERTEDGRLYVYLTPAEHIKPDAVPYTVQELLKHLQRENDFLRKEVERKDHLLAAALERLAAALERIPPALGAPPKLQGSPVSSPETSASSKAEREQLAEEADENPDEHQGLAESLERRTEPSSLQEAEGNARAQATPLRANQPGSGKLTTTKAAWPRIVLATLLAGAIPPLLANLVVLVAAYYIVGYAINHYPLVDVYLFFYFLVHLLPLPLGIRAGLAWPGNHPKGYALLGIAAGAMEALINGSIVLVAGDIVVLAIEDYVAVFSTATLFVSGALYADVIEARRRIPTPSEGAAGADAAGLNKTTVLLIQSIAPAMLGLVGTLVTALATLLKP